MVVLECGQVAKKADSRPKMVLATGPGLSLSRRFALVPRHHRAHALLGACSASTTVLLYSRSLSSSFATLPCSHRTNHV